MKSSCSTSDMIRSHSAKQALLIIALFLHINHIQSLGKLTLQTARTARSTAEAQRKAASMFPTVPGGSLGTAWSQGRILALDHKVL